MTFVGAETLVTDQWIEDQLAPLVVGDVITGIYQENGPVDAAYPFAVYTSMSIRDVRVVGGIRVMVDTLYVVKAVAQTSMFVELRPQAAAIDAALNTLDTAPVLNGFVVTSFREEPYRQATFERGEDFRSLGGLYRIHAQAI
jgi:hypothetical protein